MRTPPFIPYFQTSRYKVETMVELANIKPGERAADLGSGDGRIVIALAQAGAEAHGYELDEKLIELSKQNIKDQVDRHSGEERIQNLLRGITIHEGDFWQEDLSQYNIICIYPMPDIMNQLEKKLFSELKENSRILLNYYPFLTKKHINQKDNIYLYQV